MTDADIKEHLKQLLGREPQVVKVKDGYIVEFLSYGAPATSLVGETEDEAMRKLYEYLKHKPKAP